MSWLKKFGEVVVKVVGLATGFEPLLLPLLPQKGQVVTTAVVSDITRISAVVATAEGMFAAVSDPSAKTGAQKLQAATPFVGQIIQSSDFMIGRKIKDQALFIKGCQEITSGMADILNSLEG